MSIPRSASTLNSPPKPRQPQKKNNDSKNDDDNEQMQPVKETMKEINKATTKSGGAVTSFRDRLGSSGIASAAAVATAAVNAAVSMKTLEAPTVGKSYIAMDRNVTTNAIDNEGLPLVYDKDLIEAYWSKERGALQQRWRVFAGKAVPFLTKMLTLFIRDGSIKEEEIPALSRRARLDLQDLGATFMYVVGRRFCNSPFVFPFFRLVYPFLSL